MSAFMTDEHREEIRTTLAHEQALLRDRLNRLVREWEGLAGASSGVVASIYCGCAKRLRDVLEEGED